MNQGAPATATLVAAMLALAGCSSGGSPAGDGSGDGPDGGGNPGNSSGPGANGTVDPLPRLGPVERVTLYFTESGLSWSPPTAGSLRIGSPASAPATGLSPDEFLAPPAASAALIAATDVKATVHLVSPYGQPSNQLYDFALWFGSTASYGLFGVMKGQAFVAPGQTQTFVLEIPFGGKRPLFVPAGASLGGVLATQFGEEANGLEMRIGGEDPSRIELSLGNYSVDPLAGLQVATQEITGSLAHAANAAACGGPEGVMTMTHAVAVGPATQWLSLKLETTGQVAPHVDNDLHLLDGGGEIAASATPLGTESILLAADALAGLQGKEVTVQVNTCGTGPSTYRITVGQGTLPSTQPG